MLKPNRKVDNYETWFTNEMFMAGTAVFLVNSKICTNSLKYPNNPKPIGISLQNVVSYATISYNEQRIAIVKGGIIQVCTKGELSIKLPKKWNPPIGQPLYADPRNGKLTWRILSKRIATVLDKQDRDGFVKILVDV